MIDRTFDVEEIKSRVDVRELVPNHGALHRVVIQGIERAVSKVRWNRSLSLPKLLVLLPAVPPERGDAIEFMKWLHG